MDNQITNRQLPLWETEVAVQPTVSLTNEQRRDLMAALAELLLSSLTESAEVRKGGEDADE
jgi:hypothetical protein